MSRLSRALRALLLALCLPALLVPSGWSARVCLCELLDIRGAAECCETPSDARASCCVERAQDSAEHVTASGCVEEDGSRCCRRIDAGRIELAHCDDAPIVAPAPPCVEVAVVHEPAPELRHRALLVARRSHAPLHVSALLPLRI